LFFIKNTFHAKSLQRYKKLLTFPNIRTLFFDFGGYLTIFFPKAAILPMLTDQNQSKPTNLGRLLYKQRGVPV
jgi:hypothetical protein